MVPVLRSLMSGPQVAATACLPLSPRREGAARKTSPWAPRSRFPNAGLPQTMFSDRYDLEDLRLVTRRGRKPRPRASIQTKTQRYLHRLIELSKHRQRGRGDPLVLDMNGDGQPAHGELVEEQDR